MTTTVTMNQAVYGPSGLMAAGSTQVLADDFAAELIHSKRATRVTQQDVGFVPVTATRDPGTGATTLQAGGEAVALYGGSDPDQIITKRGRVLAQLTRPVQTIGVTTAAHALTTERPRFGSHTRKMTAQSATQSELRFPLPNPVTPDADDVALSVDIYIDGIPDPHAVSPNHPRISLILSNTTNAGSNFRQYIFDAAYMRQGWNTLKFRAGDVNNTKFVGNMAFGSSYNETGTGLNWAAPIQYVAIQMTNMNGMSIYIDDVRQPARAKPVLVIGFDDSGEELLRSVVPLFDEFGFKSYVTFTGVYEEANAGEGRAWERLKEVYAAGWDVLNHTTNHGGTTVGRSQPVSLSRTTNVVTVGPLPSSHGVPLNRMFKARISNASTPDLNGVWDMFAPTADTFQYTATGANVNTTGDIRTQLSDVFSDDTAENRRLLAAEITDCTRLLNTSGFARHSGAMVWPNNSVPNLSMVEDICRSTGIYVARGARGGYTPVNEFGVVGPLECGSFDMDSGPTSHNRVSGIKARIRGMIDRGEHLWLYGHFIQRWADAGGPIVDPDAPPGINGNPPPPAGALSGAGGWWYYEMLESVIRDTVGPAIEVGELLVMQPSEYVRYMGLPYTAD